MMAIKILRTVGATKMADAVDRWMRRWTSPPTWSPLIARQSRTTSWRSTVLDELECGWAPREMDPHS